MKRFADHREVLPDYPGGVYAVERKWAGENRAALVRFLQAWNSALAWCRDDKNREEAIQLLAGAEKIDPSAAANRLRQLPPNGRLSLPGLQSVLDLRVLFKLTPAMGSDLASYYDEDFYREASNQ